MFHIFTKSLAHVYMPASTHLARGALPYTQTNTPAHMIARKQLLTHTKTNVPTDTHTHTRPHQPMCERAYTHACMQACLHAYMQS